MDKMPVIGFLPLDIKQAEWFGLRNNELLYFALFNRLRGKNTSSNSGRSEGLWLNSRLRLA